MQLQSSLIQLQSSAIIHIFNSFFLLVKIKLESSEIAFLLVKTELESSLIIIVTSHNWIRELEL